MTESAPTKKILLTRPRASSERWAALLARHGFTCLIGPLLLIRATGSARPPGQHQAVMITSANAIDAFEENRDAVTGLLGLPCFCVGAVTGEAARVLGFTDIKCGVAGSAELAKMMMAALPDKSLPILHIAGDIVDGKAQEMLAAQGYTLAIWPVYEAVAAEDFSPGLIAALKKGEIGAIPVFSPRSARILISLIEKNRLGAACHGITAVGLSQAVADVLQSLPWRRLCVAAKPSEEEILACLQSEPVMSEPVSVNPPPKPAPSRKKSNGLAWAAAAVIVVAVAGAAALHQCPWLRNALHPTAQSDAEITGLEQRVTALEEKLNAQPNAVSAAAVPAVTAAPKADEEALDALNGDVKNLQTQLDQQSAANKAAAQKLVAEAFAFWDLRAAAATGHGFTAQLAAFKKLAGDDAAIGAQAAQLDAYAALGAPAFPQLHDELVAQESMAVVPQADVGAQPGWWARIKSIMGNLVSVHPAQRPQFADLEKALAAGDGDAAQAAFAALPDEVKKNFSAWQDELKARVTIDDALGSIATHFTAPPVAGSAP